MAEFGTVDVAVRCESDVGESPFWDSRSSRLSWVDLLEGRIHESELTTTSYSTVSYDLGPIGAALPRKGHRGYAIAGGEGFGFIEGSGFSLVDSIAGAGFRMNDAKCDAYGRMWAGMVDIGFAPGAGSLHVWGGEVPSVLSQSGFTLPNGLGWTSDNSKMLLVDSLQGVLLTAPFDLDDAAVGDFELLASIPQGLPDGISVDSDDCVWVAVWGGSQIQRISPTGKLLQTVMLPVSQPSSCCFGPDGVLFVTSARHGLSPVQLGSQPLAGCVFAVQVNAASAPAFVFGN